MKERLTGAIILVALMVLLVPELLTGPLRTKSPPAAAVPTGASPPAQAGGTTPAQPPLETYTLALQPSTGAGGGSATPSAPGKPGGSIADGGTPGVMQSAAHQAAAAMAPRSATGSARGPSAAPAAALEPGNGPQPAADIGAARSRPQPPRETQPHPPARQALQVAKPPAHRSVREVRTPASSRGWVVQLGSFADHRNALRLTRSLEARGFRMSLDRTRAGSRVLWRVRTGLMRDRAGAEHLAARLRALGHRGEVLPVR